MRKNEEFIRMKNEEEYTKNIMCFGVRGDAKV